MDRKIQTKHGTAILDGRYYRISSRKEGNHRKLLHRVVWEEFYSKSIPKGYVIHHMDGNRANCNIWNLQCVEKTLHTLFHSKQKTNCSGYYRVTKMNDSRVKQGFRWVYQYSDKYNRKAITSVSLDRLKDKVQKQGLLWYKIGDVNV